MDKQAIDRICELARGEMNLPPTFVPIAAIPQGMSVQSLEAFLQSPLAFKQTFNSSDLGNFCDYVKAHAGDTSCVYVDDLKNAAVCLFDHGNEAKPDWARHRAHFVPVETEDFVGVLKGCGRPLSQRELTDFLEDWASILTPYAPTVEAGVTLTKAVASIRKVDIKAVKNSTHEQGDLRAARSGFESIEAQSGDGILPEGFLATVALYRSTQARQLLLRLSMRTGGNEPHFMLRILEIERHRKEVADEIKAFITGHVADAKLFLGTVSR